RNVTGVQTCALPIFQGRVAPRRPADWEKNMSVHAVIDLETTSLDPANGRILSIGVACQEIDKHGQARGKVATVEIPVMADDILKIGRASCRERVERW